MHSPRWNITRRAATGLILALCCICQPVFSQANTANLEDPPSPPPQAPEQSAEDRTKVADPREVAALKDQLERAATLYSQKKLKAARKLQEQTLETSERALGNDHPTTVQTRNDLTKTLLAQGDLDGARQLPVESLVSSSPSGEPITVSAVQMEEFRSALNMIKKLEDMRATPDRWERALALFKEGKLDEARELQEQVLEAIERIDAAQQLQEQVLAAMERILGSNHRETLATRDALAKTLKVRELVAAMREQLRAMGLPPDALRETMAQILKAREQTVGPDDPLVMTARIILTSVLEPQEE